jgi:hypothetical protein
VTFIRHTVGVHPGTVESPTWPEVKRSVISLQRDREISLFRDQLIVNTVTKRTSQVRVTKEMACDGGLQGPAQGPAGGARPPIGETAAEGSPMHSSSPALSGGPRVGEAGRPKAILSGRECTLLLYIKAALLINLSQNVIHIC